MNPIQSIDLDEAWLAVNSRDRRWDGRLYYGVASTHIYCRPSCPSRRPRPEMVSYYASLDAAEAAGFRPCKRCRPRDADLHAALVSRACHFVQEHLDETLDLTTLAGVAGMSPAHFQRMFKERTGITPRAYVAAERSAKLKNGLKAGHPVTESIFDAGYGSLSRASDPLGMKPSNYRAGGLGEQIDYVIAPCALGYVLVAATARGICSVTLGDSPDVLRTALIAELPAAMLTESELPLLSKERVGVRSPDSAGLLADALTSLLAHLNGSQPDLSLPTDVRATAFQRRVWEALRAIPYGETRSYEDVATALGAPTATRAVARACATNPTALVVPCHRVVRKDGGLSGYRWGVERKRRLLETEKSDVGLYQANERHQE